MAKSDKELTKDLGALKQKSIQRMKDVIDEDGGWYILSKEISAHKAILGKLLGNAVEDDEGSEQDAADLANVMSDEAK